MRFTIEVKKCGKLLKTIDILAEQWYNLITIIDLLIVYEKNDCGNSIDSGGCIMKPKTIIKRVLVLGCIVAALALAAFAGYLI